MEQLNQMKHALGLPRKPKPYRNYFFLSKPSQDWEELVGKGFANRSKGDEKVYYWLTFEGAKLVYGKRMSKKYFDEL
jgi:hypothetical protein